MKVLLIGTGRLAFHLAHALARSSAELIGIAGRNAQKTAALATKADTVPYTIDDPPSHANVIILAVKDDAIEEVAGALRPRDAVIVHTSGASSTDLLLPHSMRGVIWPVQTFGGVDPVDLAHVPLVIDGNNDPCIAIIRDLSSRLSERVVHADHLKRKKLHLASVFASNFPVAMMMEAEKILQQTDLPTDLLASLWLTSARNVEERGAKQSLTGPAARADRSTIQQHLDLLNEDGELQELYRMMSERIMRK